MKPKYTILTGIPGCGKTKQLISDMLSQPGKYIFATTRVELLKERRADIVREAQRNGREPLVHLIHSGKTGTRSVARSIEDAPKDFAHLNHVILLVTHEGLMSADLGNYLDWHAIVDEPPAGVSSEQLRLPAMTSWFQNRYKVTYDQVDLWPRIAARPNAPSISDLQADQCASSLIPFAKRINSPSGVRVDPDDWGNFPKTGKLGWVSVWTPAELQNFASVTLAGSGFSSSLSYKAMQSLHSSDFEVTTRTISNRSWNGQPSIKIAYFTQHHGSTEYWSREEGQDCVAKIADYLEGLPSLDYYSANKAIIPRLENRLAGRCTSPKLEGTNDLREYTSCAFMYSAKATPKDAPALKALKLTPTEIERAREQEDIIQFVFRGAIRNPEFHGVYNVYLYSRCQAEALQSYLNENGFSDVELEGIDECGLLDKQRPKAGRPRKIMCARSADEKKASKRAKDSARKRKWRAEMHLRP